MTMTFVDHNQPTTSNAIDAFERERNLTLPRSYRQFLLTTNGGRPKDTNFPVRNFARAKTWDLTSLLGIGVTHPGNELSYAYDLYVGGFPRGIIPIANDDFGNYVCIDLRKGTDKISFWEKSHFWSTGEWQESDFYHVAATFDEFMASLRPSPY